MAIFKFANCQPLPEGMIHWVHWSHIPSSAMVNCGKYSSMVSPFLTTPAQCVLDISKSLEKKDKIICM